MDALPEHLQADIVSRLDWKSLARAATVCRLWRSMVIVVSPSCVQPQCCVPLAAPLVSDAHAT